MNGRRIFFGVSLVCMLVLVIGAGVKRGRDKELLAYKNDLKQYVSESNAFSEEEKAVLRVAIDHIERPESIGNPRMIRVYWLSQKYTSDDEIDLKSEAGKEIKAKDWQVDIGDTAYHKNFSAIIDGETLEFVMQIPIA